MEQEPESEASQRHPRGGSENGTVSVVPGHPLSQSERRVLGICSLSRSPRHRPRRAFRRVAAWRRLDAPGELHLYFHNRRQAQLGLAPGQRARPSPEPNGRFPAEPAPPLGSCAGHGARSASRNARRPWNRTERRAGACPQLGPSTSGFELLDEVRQRRDGFARHGVVDRRTHAAVSRYRCCMSAQSRSISSCPA